MKIELYHADGSLNRVIVGDSEYAGNQFNNHMAHRVSRDRGLAKLGSEVDANGKVVVTYTDGTKAVIDPMYNHTDES